MATADADHRKSIADRLLRGWPTIFFIRNDEHH